MWRLCGVLTLAVYISPNNSPIDLLSIEEMNSCNGNAFCTLNHFSWTIIDEVTVPLSTGVVGLLVGSHVSNLKKLPT
jgi:hypothetical protein